MSKATKRKHVTKEVMDDYVVPDDNQEIVKILAGRGNNLHEVENADGKHFLVSMPPKFRKNVWIKRGDFIIIDPIEEGNKVCGEIVYILYSKQVKYLKQENLWPESFTDKEEKETKKENTPTKSNKNTNKDKNESPSGSESEDCDDDLFVNTNRPPVLQYSDDSDSEEEEENIAKDEEDEQDK